MKILPAFVVAALCALTSCTDDSGPATDAHVYADLYYRYDKPTDAYTAEARLSHRDSTLALDTAYAVPGGVAFQGSNVNSAPSTMPSVSRYQSVFRGTKAAPARFTLRNLDGNAVEVPGSLAPIDTVSIGVDPSKNYGYTVYFSLDGDHIDSLTADESISAVFTSDEGVSKLGTIIGPTNPSVGFKFPRNTIADWPLGEGEIIFIRRRTTPLNRDGIRGQLVEEQYSYPIRTAITN